MPNKSKNVVKSKKGKKAQQQQAQPQRRMNKMQGPSIGLGQITSRRVGPMAQVFGKLVEGMCDPFSKPALGCQCPDGRAGESIPYQLHGLGTIGTAANANGVGVGQGLAVIASTGQIHVNSASAIAGGNWTLGAAYTSLYTDTLFNTLVNTDNGRYRVVCGGFVLRTLQNMANAQGELILTKVPTRPPASGAWPVQAVRGASRIFPIYNGLEVVVLFQPVGDNSSNFNYYPGNLGDNGTSPQLESGWDACMIEINGASAASTNIFSVEWILNVEIIPQSKDVTYQAMGREAPPANPLSTLVASAARREMGHFFEGSLTQFSRYAQAAVQRALGRVAGGSLPLMIAAAAA